MHLRKTFEVLCKECYSSYLTRRHFDLDTNRCSIAALKCVRHLTVDEDLDTDLPAATVER